MVAPHHGVFRTLANTRHQGAPPGAPRIADPFVEKGAAGKEIAFLNGDSLKHRKLELRDENQKSTDLLV